MIAAPADAQWTWTDAGAAQASASIVGATCPPGADGFELRADPFTPPTTFRANPSCNFGSQFDTLTGGVWYARIRWTLGGVPVSGFSPIKSVDIEPSAAALAQVTDWVTRINAAGGSSPSAANQRAHAFFYDRINSAGILSKLLIVNSFTPDNLIAAITPFIKGGGFNSWSNSNFVSGDLSVNGLTGNGTNKSLNTGFSPVSVLDHTTGGIIVYNITNNNSTTECEVSSFDTATTKGFQFFDSFAGTFVGDCYYNGGSARISAVNVGFLGYVSMQRISAVSFAVYKANSTTAHTSFGTNANDGGTPPTTNVACFCTNSSGTLANFSAKQLSFISVTLGLTSSEDTSCFNAVQKLRTALGGGFV